MIAGLSLILTFYLSTAESYLLGVRRIYFLGPSLLGVGEFYSLVVLNFLFYILGAVEIGYYIYTHKKEKENKKEE